MRRFLFCVPLLLLAWPAAGSEPARAAKSGRPSGAVRTPLVVRLEVLAQQEGRVELRAHVERRSPLPLPIEVAFVLPPGVRQVRGEAKQVLPPSDRAGEVPVDVAFEFERAPAEDLQVVASAQADWFGVTAKDVYRFGRPAPEPVAPLSLGSELRVGQRKLGRAISLPEDAKGSAGGSPGETLQAR